MKTCPKCKREYKGHPALSRLDNKTYICPACGIAEALDAVPDQHMSQIEKSEILKAASKYDE